MAEETTAAPAEAGAGTQTAETQETTSEGPDLDPTQGTDGLARQLKQDMARERSEATEPETAAPEGEPDEAPEAEADTERPPEPTPAEDRIADADLPEGYSYDERGRLHGPDGGYVNEETVRSRMEESDADEQATETQPESEAEETSVEAEEETDSEDVPDAVEVPEGHWLRDQGFDEIPLPEGADEATESAFRGILNDAVRKKELQRARQEAAEYRKRLAAIQAERDVLDSEEAKRYDPDSDRVQRVYEDMKDAYGEDYADDWLEGVKAKRDKILEERRNEALGEAEQEQMAVEFLHGIDFDPQTASFGQQARQVFPVWAQNGELDQRLNRALVTYAEAVENGQARPDPQSFYKWVWDSQYARDPRAHPFHQQGQANGGQPRQANNDSDGRYVTEDELQSLREEIKQEVREDIEAEQREKAKDAATRHGTKHPLGKTPPADAGKRTPRGDAEQDFTGKSVDQIKKELRTSG